MNVSRLVLVTALGLGLSSTACLGNTDPLAENIENIEPPRFKPLMDPGGGIGTNSLSPSIFHANKGLLLEVMKHQLTPDTLADTESVINTGLLSNDGGDVLFKYVNRCVRPDSAYLPVVDPQHPPYSLLGNTANWFEEEGNPLSLPQRNSIFSCLLTHLNPSVVPVSIYLSGADVPDRNQPDAASHTFDEALWTARVSNDGNSVTLVVWPMADLERACGVNEIGTPKSTNSMQTRVCGEWDENGNPTCGVQIMHGSCDKSPEGFYTCGGMPAIQTRLRPGDVSILHGGCIP